MYIGEQIKDLEEFLRVFFRRMQSGLWTMMPAVVNAWNYPNTGKNTVTVVPAVMGQTLQADGTWLAQPMPAHPDVPVHYLGSGGMVLTHPIASGDEGMLLYASRCLDSWWQNGGIQPRPDYGTERMHDLSDAIFVPGKISVPNTPTGLSTTTSQLRSVDGAQYIEMAAGGVWNIKGTAVNLIGNDGATCSLTVTGEITRGYGTSDSVTLGQHEHPTAATGSPSAPTPGT